ncbi:MAG: 16S rRNA pseudouridine516 synthase [Paraglaciecola sp.]|jgi:16S rRNA pseudouridine516 synthase
MAALKRLDQTLSNLGYCSRREARYFIRDKRVTIAGELAKSASQKVDTGVVLVDGEPLEHPRDLLIMLHKPLGYVCTHDSNEGLRIYDLLPPRWQDRNPQVISIGRLDKDTSGLILVTDQSALVHRLTSPKKHVAKIYRVTLDKALTDDVIELFAQGVELENEIDLCLPAKLEIIDELTALVTLNEGKYHQIRRMFAACGYHVEALHREQFGEYTLADLPAGQWLDLAP